eukprot:m.136750 g.136750  ORF g.136750 m.136750 type:complete len:291 (-) comp29878_c0_seq1:117-989(-)
MQNSGVTHWSDIGVTESGLAFARRRRAVKPLGNLGFPPLTTEVQNGDVIELYGPEGSGKSTVTLQMIVECVLPLSHGGSEAGVIVLDTDFKFSISRLTAMIEYKILSTKIPNTSVKELVHKALARVYVAKVDSMEQLVATIYAIDVMMQHRPDVRMVVVDSISAFYWLECNASGLTHKHKAAVKTTELVAAIRSLFQKHSLVVVVTKSTLFGSTQPNFTQKSIDNPRGCHHEFMPNDWQQFVTKRVAIFDDWGQRNTQRNNKVARLILPLDRDGWHQFSIADEGLCFSPE